MSPTLKVLLLELNEVIPIKPWESDWDMVNIKKHYDGGALCQVHHRLTTVLYNQN